MKRRLVLTCGALLAGLWAATAMAAGPAADTPAAPAAQAEQGVSQGAEPGAPDAQLNVPGAVPQAQIDINKKREEARQRRDEALRVRAQMMQAGQ